MAGKSPTDLLSGEEGDRRSFFRTTVGRAARTLAQHAEKRVVQQRYLRPPGALEEVMFLAACTRCGECMPVCPVNAIVKVPASAGLAAGTPKIDARVQACIACADMPCAAACPTPALTIPDDGWAGYRMATLELDPDRCIAFRGSECGLCAQACPVGEAAIGVDEATRPILRPEGCVGCGMCVRACVTTPSSLILHY